MSWPLVRLGDLMHITSSKRVFQNEWRNRGVPFYRARELVVLARQRYVQNELFIDEDLYNLLVQQTGAPQPEDLLVTGVGTLGRTYVVRPGDRFYFKDGNIIWLKRSDRIDTEFLAQLYKTPSLMSQVLGESAGTTVGTYTITNAKNTVVQLPPMEVQQRIAKALADADDLIATLEHLIAKKRAIKQGMMQELLTGRTRLPGFSSARKEWRLSDVAVRIQDGTHFSPRMGGNDYKYITSRNIGYGRMILGEVETISPEEHRKIFTRCEVRFGDLLITKDGANTGNAAINPFREEISLLSSVAFIRCDPCRADECYLLQYLLSDQGQRTMKNAMAGNAITRLTLAKIRNLIVQLPHVDEQRAIASVLSDADREIVALERHLEATRDMKRGMMQELLTGRTRLPVED